MCGRSVAPWKKQKQPGKCTKSLNQSNLGNIQRAYIKDNLTKTKKSAHIEDQSLLLTPNQITTICRSQAPKLLNEPS